MLYKVDEPPLRSNRDGVFFINTRNNSIMTQLLSFAVECYAIAVWHGGFYPRIVSIENGQIPGCCFILSVRVGNSLLTPNPCSRPL